VASSSSLHPVCSRVLVGRQDERRGLGWWSPGLVEPLGYRPGVDTHEVRQRAHLAPVCLCDPVDEDVPGLVELEVAVPRSAPALR